MVVATKNDYYNTGTAVLVPNGLGTGDPAAAKRYIKALVQTGNPATECTSYDEMEVMRQTASLGTHELGRLLGTIAEELQTELTGRVNEEFEGFVSLFKDIGAMGEEESVVLADKVALIRGLVHEVERASRNDLGLLEGILSQYRDNMTERKRLLLARRFQEDLERLAILLDDCSVSAGDTGGKRNGSDDDYNDDSGVILQLATEFFLKVHRLMIAASGRVGLPSTLLDRFAQLTASLHGCLDDALLKVLRTGKATAFQDIALVMIRIGKGAILTEAFANEFWGMRLQSIVNKGRFEEMIRKGSSVERATEAMFGELTHAIKSVRQGWFANLPLEEAVPSLFCHAVLSPTFARLTRELPTLFSPALPDVFHSNFQASCRFVEETCVQLLAARELAYLNEDGAFQTYAKAWQLNVYFQLRFRDYAQALEEALTRSTEASLSLLERLCAEMVSGPVVLRPLVPKFHRLRLQCVARAARYWEERLQLEEEPSCGMKGGERQSVDVAIVKAHSQLVEQAFKFLDLRPIEPLLGEIDGAIDKFKDLNKRFHEHLRQAHEALVGRYRTLRTEACLREISSWKGGEGEGGEEGEKASSALVLFFETCEGQPSEKAHDLGDSQGYKRDNELERDYNYGNDGDKDHGYHDYGCELFDDDFRLSLYKEGLSRFITRANELLAQRRKAVANYKRLRSIMKDKRPSTSTLSSTASTPSTVVEPDEGVDPEAQLVSLIAAIKEMADRLRRLGEGLLGQTTSLESQLSTLSL